MPSSRDTPSPRSATLSLPSQGTSSGSSTLANRDDLAGILQGIFDNISSWKSSLEEFGTSYDPLRSNIDALHVRFECFLVHARMSAEKGATLSYNVRDLLKTISSCKDPDRETEKRVSDRVERLKKDCEDVVDECQVCKGNFLEVYGLLYDILDDLDEKEAQLRKEVKSTKSKESRARTITKIATSVGLVASAAAALTTLFFSMGTSALVIAPIAVSAATPIISYYSTSRSAASTKLIEMHLHEGDILQKIIEEAWTGTEDVAEMTRWWHSVQEEIISLQSCLEKLQWGSKRTLVYSLKDWEALEDRFKEYSGQLKRVSSKAKSRKRTPSPVSSGTVASGESSKSSRRKVDAEAVVQVRRVNEPTVLTKPRRAKAVTNSSSARNY
ncbi:hypothetical protein SCHPADRAFT_937820 [Schizopora paradoxa]|uniref:Uncharacterized protein n=1 Tax=Schizopora paradoxa TaxID=27342 RepID=A0A0H2RWS8_9AGAM|nr:hypothetical protein SCHPADRAFT_937820 [Schizopora paradoxa]